ncbi:MAG: hypothetical protein CR984_02500 [Proteobacteria bacterium]|nr:MAG: hypothetical protein CR984_02500 [Pseudomonadota bacterium]
MDKSGFSLIEVLVSLTLTVLVAVYLGTQFSDAANDESAFDRTCHTMEAFREAVLGRPGYCNGVRQFSGYVADMGNPPTLYQRNGEGTRPVDYDTADPESIFNGSFSTIVQPFSLWTRDLDADGRVDIPDKALWNHTAEGIWAGWKGPYLDPPVGGVLRDGWGNPFIFVLGQLVTKESEDPGNPYRIIQRTFRCIRTHQSMLDNTGRDLTREPGTADGQAYWQEIDLAGSGHIDVYAWVPGGKDLLAGKNNMRKDIPRNNDYYYADALVMVSYGQDGKPGGDGLNRDLVLTVYSQQYTGEVGGHAGYQGNLYTGSVTLIYPDFTEAGGRVRTREIRLRDNDAGYGINFRFGSSDAVEPIKGKYLCENCENPGDDCDCIGWTAPGCIDNLCRLTEVEGYFVKKDDGSGLREGCVCIGLRCIYEDDPDRSWVCDSAFDDGRTWYCVEAVCDHDPGEPDLQGGDDNYVCECREWGSRCDVWKCAEIPADSECECQIGSENMSKRFVNAAAETNSADVAVPVGVRALSTASGKMMIPVDVGMNWVGTVK